MAEMTYNVRIYDEKPKVKILMLKGEPGGGTATPQVYRGPTEPTDENILIWIDTSEEPVVKGRLLTAEGKPFITVDGKNFLVAQTENGTRNIPVNTNSIEENETLSIEDYVSKYTGAQIDAGIDLAYTALQEHQDLSGYQLLITVNNKLSSDLVDDTNATNLFVTEQEKTTWNAKSDFSGDYDDLRNKPTIPTVPTDVSAFNNDAGYLTLATLPIYEGEVDSEESL